MKKITVEYETSDYCTDTGERYTLYFFYIQQKSGYWLWDEDKLLLEEALIKYPRNKYKWKDITGEE